ncbi:MAG: hypothetical protein ACYCU8_00015 [Ferrimicrobium acidiphilum]
MPNPTPNQVADYFAKVYGADRLYITCLVASVGGGDQISTFGSDNIEHMPPWLRMMSAKLESGSVASVSMVVRVFDFDSKIEVIGAKGRVAIPCKEIYMFRFDPQETIGFNIAETAEMHCTDADTGQPMPVEAGVSFGSGADVVAAMS